MSVLYQMRGELSTVKLKKVWRGIEPRESLSLATSLYWQVFSELRYWRCARAKGLFGWLFF